MRLEQACDSHIFISSLTFFTYFSCAFVPHTLYRYVVVITQQPGANSQSFPRHYPTPVNFRSQLAKRGEPFEFLLFFIPLSKFFFHILPDWLEVYRPGTRHSGISGCLYCNWPQQCKRQVINLPSISNIQRNIRRNLSPRKFINLWLNKFFIVCSYVIIDIMLIGD